MIHTTFKDFPLLAPVQETLDRLGFVEPTDIQSKTLPILLESPKQDIHGQAQTGTGKTLAFGLPLLHRINSASRLTQGLVIAPTRELALQICESIQPFAHALGLKIKTIYGGVSMEDQIQALRAGVHIVVGTPGRVIDHLNRKTLNLSEIKTVVLDEADIMLDMGFKEEVEDILKFAPSNREIWLFSATVKSGISMLMKEHMQDTVSVRVSKAQVGSTTTQQHYCVVPQKNRTAALCRFIESAPEFYGFIFCQTKLLTSEIADRLTRQGYIVGALHGDMSQAQRNAVIKKFRSREISIVVATDVAARGIDIQDLTHVVNYSFPEDHESYVHRVGRTGRAGKEGTAITFISRSELRLVKMVENKFNVKITPLDVPSRDHIIKARMHKVNEYLTHHAESPMLDIHAEIHKVVDKYTPEEAHSILKHIVHETFLKTILAEEEIAVSNKSFSSITGAATQELCLAVGTDDGVTKEDVIEHITSTNVIAADQISKIRIIKRKTFVEVPIELGNAVMRSLFGGSLAGRRTRIQLVEESKDENHFSSSRDKKPSRSYSRSDRFGQRDRSKRKPYSSNSSRTKDAHA